MALAGITLFIIVAVAALIPAVYLLVITIAAYGFRPRRVADAAPVKTVILIPAHNEALSIADTVAGALAVDYPADRSKVVVLADNCDDDTATIARNAGAEVVERFNDAQRGKGQALHWFLTEQTDRYDGWDAIAIIDADTRIDPRFLLETSASLAHPNVDVMQGYYGVSNPKASWRTALTSAALAVFHHVRPAGRNRLSGTAGLRGNGMAFRTTILRAHGWPAHSVVEDVEYTINLLHEGILVAYNPRAIVRGEMAASAQQAGSQRERWESGRMQILRRHAPRLLREFLKRPTAATLDELLELVTPPLSQVVLLLVAVLAMSIVWFPAWIAWIGAGLGAVLFYVISGLILHREPFGIWLALLGAPLYIAWKIPIRLKMRFGRTTKRWVRTTREKEIHNAGTSGD